MGQNYDRSGFNFPLEEMRGTYPEPDPDYGRPCRVSEALTYIEKCENDILASKSRISRKDQEILELKAKLYDLQNHT